MINWTPCKNTQIIYFIVYFCVSRTCIQWNKLDRKFPVSEIGRAMAVLDGNLGEARERAFVQAQEDFEDQSSREIQNCNDDSNDVCIR